MRLFRRKGAEFQQTPEAVECLPDHLRITDMPPGTKFQYLGVQCVVIDYAPEWAGEHLGIYGMEFHYADERGVIRTGRILPRHFQAFRSAVEISVPKEELA